MNRGIFLGIDDRRRDIRTEATTLTLYAIHSNAMGDSDQKKSSVPAWETDLKKATPTEGDTEPQPPSRDALIEQAKKFLEEDEVRNASTDKKISFLEGKGLSSEEIQSLIGVARHPEASSTPASSTVSTETLTSTCPPTTTNRKTHRIPPPLSNHVLHTQSPLPETHPP